MIQDRYPLTTQPREVFRPVDLPIWVRRLRDLELLNRSFDQVDDFSSDLTTIETRARRVRAEETP